MARKSIPSIITNRQLNFTLSPVDKYNKKEMPYRLQNYEIDGTWNQHQSIILDCILDRIFNGTYRQYKKPPQSWRSEKTIQVIYGYFGGILNPSTLHFVEIPLYEAFIEYSGKDVFGKIKTEYRNDKEKRINYSDNIIQYLNHWHGNTLSDYRKFNKNILNLKKILYADLVFDCKVSELLENYPFLMRYKYTLEEKLNKVASTKFKMKYKVKYMDKLPVFDENGKVTERGNLVDMYYEMKNLQHMFKVAFEDDIIKFNFNSPLGKLIIYNMLIVDTDWMPLDVLNLTKNAYFLYKRFVLNKRSAKFKPSKIELKLEEIKSFLDYNWSNDRGVHSKIIEALNNMKDNGLIDDFVWNKNIANRRVYKLIFEDKKKEPKKQKDAAGKELKMIA